LSSFGQQKKERARAYVLAHPDESKRQQAIAVGCGERLIAFARAELIAEGKLVPSRKMSVAGGQAEIADNQPREPRSVPAAKVPEMLDSEAMRALADMEALDSEDLSDEEIHKRLVKLCIRFAFDPKLHPDTRMSASLQWAKLKDQQKSNLLGPRKPMTFEDGVFRLSDLMRECGPEMVMAALNVAFDVKEKGDEGKVPADQGQAAPGAAPDSPAP
jgi:hypothetical protein